uniref:uncharacterized protein n=1 Tax=Myxine glutinosa TaxID=7769 RepID=UPI00358FB4AA
MLRFANACDMACSLAIDPHSDFDAWLGAQGMKPHFVQVMAQELGISNYDELLACAEHAQIRAELYAEAHRRLPFAMYALLRRVVAITAGFSTPECSVQGPDSRGLLDAILATLSGLSRELISSLQRFSALGPEDAERKVTEFVEDVKHTGQQFTEAPSAQSPLVDQAPVEVMDVGIEEKVPEIFELNTDNVEHGNLIPACAADTTNLLPAPIDNGYGECDTIGSTSHANICIANQLPSPSVKEPVFADKSNEKIKVEDDETSCCEASTPLTSTPADAGQAFQCQPESAWLLIAPELSQCCADFHASNSGKVEPPPQVSCLEQEETSYNWWLNKCENHGREAGPLVCKETEVWPSSVKARSFSGKPHYCTECGLRFAFRSKLEVHRRTHTGERPYACEMCGMTFAQSYNLLRHKRTHMAQRPYVCSRCGRGFIRRGQFLRHSAKCVAYNVVLHPGFNDKRGLTSRK